MPPTSASVGGYTAVFSRTTSAGLLMDDGVSATASLAPLEGAGPAPIADPDPPDPVDETPDLAQVRGPAAARRALEEAAAGGLPERRLLEAFASRTELPMKEVSQLARGLGVAAGVELVLELARRSFSSLTRQEIYVIYYIAGGLAGVIGGTMLAGGPFGGRPFSRRGQAGQPHGFAVHGAFHRPQGVEVLEFDQGTVSGQTDVGVAAQAARGREHHPHQVPAAGDGVTVGL